MTRLLTRSLYVPVVLPVVEICGAENVLVQTNGLKARMFCYAANVSRSSSLLAQTLGCSRQHTESFTVCIGAHLPQEHLKCDR